MSDPAPQHVPTVHRRPPHAVIRCWGVTILLVGLIGAGLIYVFAADDRDTDLAGEITSTRMYQHNLELMGGKFAVYADQFNQWFSSLWHGKPLAYTVAVLAVAIALVCFWVAYLSVPLPSEGDQQRDD
jgi:hypothetical protein